MATKADMPAGCVCNPNDWGDVLPVCTHYDHNDEHGWCSNCQHDEACHAKEVRDGQ